MNASDESKLFARLAGFDTPSVCNALEIAAGGRRATGFTRTQLQPSRPDIKPFIGRARTATLRSIERPDAASKVEWRIEYFRYAARPGVVVVLEDLDRPAGLGAFWGEVHSAVHASLGVAGIITNGSMRDVDAIDQRLPILAGSIAPSHACVDIEQLDATVNVCGMTVVPGSIVHADKHGAVVIPDELAVELPAALDLIVRREARILSAAAKPGFGQDELEAALREAREIH